MKIKSAILGGVFAVAFLVACSTIGKNEPQPETRAFPTATYHFLLQGNAPKNASADPASGAGVPTVASIFREHPSPTFSPSPVATSTLIPPFTATQTPQPVTVSVYDDHLHPNWIMQQNTGVKADLKSTIHVYQGKSAISFIPRVKDKTQYGSLFFTVSDQSKEMYLRDQVTTLSFWLYSGDEPLLLDQVAVSILGSNSQPYWEANDHSVLPVGDQSPVFSETRLYFLGFNRDIPAKTWVQVQVDLDKLIYDPDYKYVTGFYLKMEKGFSRTLWVDDINLLMLSKPADTSATQPSVP